MIIIEGTRTLLYSNLNCFWECNAKRDSDNDWYNILRSYDFQKAFFGHFVM